MNTFNQNKSIFNYKSGDGGVDSYGVDHSGFTLRDELEYQMARVQREEELNQHYNISGITNNNLSNGISFWGNSSDNNYGFGTSNISQNIENVTNQLKNSGEDRKQDFKMVDFSNQTLTPWSYNAVVQQQTTSTPWEKKRYMSGPLNNGTISFPKYDNYLTEQQRIQALKNNQPLNLQMGNSRNADYSWPWYTIDWLGKYYVDKYNNDIEKYAVQNNLDPDLVKAIMYNEGATGHKVIFNYLGDLFRASGSQMPMNIQGKTWNKLDGKSYNTYNSQQNIELGTKVLKQIQNSLNGFAPDKIGTLWNETGANNINNVGARVKTAYETKPWLGEKQWQQKVLEMF